MVRRLVRIYQRWRERRSLDRFFDSTYSAYRRGAISEEGFQATCNHIARKRRKLDAQDT